MSSILDCAIISRDHEAVEQFIERLSALRLDEWLSVAAAANRDASSRADVNATLELLIAQHGLGVEAWSIADDVETAVHYSLGSNGVALSRRDGASIRLARPAATRAALGLFLRPLLTSDDFELLYRPFASLGPQIRLVGGSV
jgi:hypothetical protein